MSYIKPKKITWVNSTSTDVTHHRFYVVAENATIDPINTTHVDLAVPVNEYNLPGIFSITEGNYKVGIAAMDTNGNISDVAEKVFPLDLMAPIAPTNLQLVDG